MVRRRHAKGLGYVPPYNRLDQLGEFPWRVGLWIHRNHRCTQTFDIEGLSQKEENLRYEEFILLKSGILKTYYILPIPSISIMLCYPKNTQAWFGFSLCHISAI